MRPGVPLCPQFFVLTSPQCLSGAAQLSWGWTDAGGSDRGGLSQVDCGGKAAGRSTGAMVTSLGYQEGVPGL